MFYSPINKKNWSVVGRQQFRGQGIFPPHLQEFIQLMCPHPGKFAHFSKLIMPGGEELAGWALLELTEALHYCNVAKTMHCTW